MKRRKSVSEILDERDAKRAQGDAGLGVTAADRERWGWFPPVGTRVRYTKEKEESMYGVNLAPTPKMGEEGSFIRTRKGVGYTLWDVQWDESGKLTVSPVGSVEVIVDGDLGDAGWDNYPNLYTHSILIKTKQYNTDTGSARVKAWVTRGGSTKTNSIPYPYEMNTTERHMAAAVALVKKFGWDGRFDPNGPRHASTPGTLVHVFVHGYP